MTRTDFLNKTELKQRGTGWTNAGIKRFLREPDETRPNPYYRSGPDVCWFRVARVEAVEASVEYLAWVEKSRERSARATKVADERAAELLAHVRKIQIRVPEMPLGALTQKAFESYNGCSSPETLASLETKFLHRITVNYLRHEATAYDALLREIAGKPGKGEAYLELFDRIMDAISSAYPDLADECLNQSRRKLQDALDRDVAKSCR